QAFQLIRGGRDQRLQTTSLMQVLDLLPDVAGWQSHEIRKLKTAYWFLRDVEHAIQGVQDKQTQELPAQNIEQARLAYAMGFDDWPSLHAQITQQRTFVRSQFDMVVSGKDEDQAGNDEIPAIAALCGELGLLNGGHDDTVRLDEWQQLLRQAGFSEPDVVLQHLLSLYQSHAARCMQAVAQERLAQLLPGLLQLCSLQLHAAQTLARVLVLIEAVLRRSVYLVLL
ncbi:MAG: bifunctional glutamine synthetase adenylyltransferase/deadenyltransferase, partial [Gammaproteobacteria bacterium]|nr:bifunctional glutamine synthetase adenylyltransferase/deadenyltransferase [Gammaproteobacteria bacterium]